MLKSSFRALILFLLGGSSLGSASITDSVIPVLDSTLNQPPNKYSDSHCQEIREVLLKKDRKIRVVTYNVLFDLFDHELEDKNYSWPKRLPGLISSVENMQPDLLSVQETYPHLLEDLEKHLGEKFFCFKGESPKGETNAIFYKKDRFEIEVESVSLQMPLNPKDDALVREIPNLLPPELEPGKQLTIAHFHDKVTDKRFVVLNTHLSYYRINSREDSAHFIIDLVRQFHAQNKAVILTGDFNTLPNRPDLERFKFHDGNHLKRIFSKVLKNTEDSALLGHAGPLTTYTKDFTKVNSKVFEGLGTPGLILDHIYVSPETAVMIHATEPSKVNGRFPSDHLPVIADILLP